MARPQASAKPPPPQSRFKGTPARSTRYSLPVRAEKPVRTSKTSGKHVLLPSESQLAPLPGDEDGGPQMGGFVMASELEGPPRMPPPNLPPQPGMIQRRPSLTAMSDPPLPQQMPFQPPINQGQAPPMQAERACAHRRR